ncbi:hypothetical protein CU098_004585 [Rhizopus stolonifer]|uniref:Uncharacterized protein n=1 Tax=Rhizopus stolonifer TaxID=4846 RepID=A0A367ITJ8_RHIST|nr:hypothetical protein CU098_004585 [Rhizopus stolonifer]
MPTYPFDVSQFADACGVDLTNSAVSSTFKSLVNVPEFAIFKLIVLIMPAAVLAFIAFACTLFVRRHRSSNAIPFIGIFASLLSFLTGAAGLALVIVTFWKGLNVLEKNIEGLSHQWGPSIYLVGVGSGCILFTLVCFTISIFSRRPDSYDKETIRMDDYNDKNVQVHAIAANNVAYDASATAYLNTPAKRDSFEYNNQATSLKSPAYPSYYQQANYQQEPQSGCQPAMYQPQVEYNLQDVYNAYEQRDAYKKQDMYNPQDNYNHQDVYNSPQAQYKQADHYDAYAGQDTYQQDNYHSPNAYSQPHEAYQQQGSYYHQNTYKQQHNANYF